MTESLTAEDSLQLAAGFFNRIPRVSSIWMTFVILLVVFGKSISHAGAVSAESAGARFFYSGDGHIRLTSEKNGKSFFGRYRLASGGYDQTALGDICRVFDAPCQDTHTGLSLRFLEYLDFLEDRFNLESGILITSGYRSPEYNTGLRSRGGLAAKASLHQYGMAADLIMPEVPAETLWQYVKKLGVGGAGYYHGETVHIDMGPARSWDEKTSGVGTGISDDNKLIGLVTDYDIYQPGMAIAVRFIRMTAFPIGLNRKFGLYVKTEKEIWERVVTFTLPAADTDTAQCPKYHDIAQMSFFQWKLPLDLSPGRYRVRASFCDNPWKGMPQEVETPEFEIQP